MPPAQAWRENEPLSVITPLGSQFPGDFAASRCCDPPRAVVSADRVYLESYRRQELPIGVGLSSGATTAWTTRARMECSRRTPSVRAAGPGCRMQLDGIS